VAGIRRSLVVAALCMALPASAHAATASSTVSTSHVTSDVPTVKYLADPGEANRLVVAGAHSAIGPMTAATFVDPGAPVKTVACARTVRGAVCSTELARYYGQDYPDEGEVHLGPGWWSQAVIDVGDGNDRLDLESGIATSGPPYPEPGTYVDGGPGDDRLDTTDGAPETIGCGDGNDTAVVDSTDTLGSTDCETVTRR
jgi:hypothetical protein